MIPSKIVEDKSNREKKSKTNRTEKKVEDKSNREKSRKQIETKKKWKTNRTELRIPR